MNNPRLSVIVPVYNTRPYLQQCLSSVFRQTLLDMEVILVNDGSTDGSKEVLKKWVNIDKRYRYVEQENGGLSIARNTGISMACGTWLFFLDSDDWLYSSDCLERLCQIADKTKVDIVSGNTWSVFSDGTKMLWGQSGKEVCTSCETMSGGEYFVRMQKGRCYVPMVYNYLYSRDFLEKYQFRFEPNLIHEDELWTPQVLTLANKVANTDISHYCYRQREGSIMLTTKVERRIASLQVIISKHLEYISNYANLKTDSKLVKEAMYVNLLRLYLVTCYLRPKNMRTTVYDQTGEMLAICESLNHWSDVGKRYCKIMLQYIKDYFNELQK